MKKDIKKAIAKLKDNDEFYTDKSSLLNEALEYAIKAQKILSQVKKMPSRIYEIVNVEFVYINDTYKASAYFFLKTETFENIKVAKKEDSYIERYKYSDKLRNHLEAIAENEFNKLMKTWTD